MVVFCYKLGGYVTPVSSEMPQMLYHNPIFRCGRITTGLLPVYVCLAATRRLYARWFAAHMNNYVIFLAPSYRTELSGLVPELYTSSLICNQRRSQRLRRKLKLLQSQSIKIRNA